MHTGPNIERDGLVFGYDTGYGVVNNISNSRFNKGAPTVNYIPSPFNYSLYAYASGPVDTTTLNERGKVINVKRYTVTQAVNTARAAIFPTGLTTGTAYTFSFKWKYNGSITSSPTVGVSAAKGNPEGGANNNSFTSETANTISIGGGWYLTTYTFTFASVPTGKAMLTFGLNTGSTAGFVNETFDIYEAQFEVKSFKSPYTAGTRSSTQSLIDLTRTSNIDVSNVSFDSTGQPTFDGTDDYILGTIPSSTFSGAHSIGCWFYRETVTQWAGLFSNNVNTTSCSILTFISTSNSLGTNQAGVNGASISVDLGADHLNKWIYAVITYAGVTSGSTVNVYAYKNGSLLTASGSLYWNLSSSSSYYIGRHWTSASQILDGFIPQVSIYNRALSAQEVQQNYRAYKNRFNI
jgi:hypothetical protein